MKIIFGKITLFVIALIVVALGVILLKTDSVSITKDSFAFHNEEALSKVLIYKRNLPWGSFIKGYDGKWQLNNSIDVDAQMAELLLKVLTTVKVKEPVAKEDREEVKDLIKAQGMVIEYYRGTFMEKAFFIADLPGKSYSYAMLEGDNTPYVIHIPGSKNNLSRLFSIPPINWKDRTIFNSGEEDIERVNVEYYSVSKDSFEITQREGKVQLSGSGGDNIKIREFLKKFMNVRGGVEISDNKILLDSLKLCSPYCTITVEDRNANKNKKLSLYHDPKNAEIIYGQINMENIIYMIPPQKLKPLLISKSDLTKRII